MLYDATAHPLLSADALRLPSETIGELNAAAEELLSLSGTSYSDADAERATRAVAFQINHMVALGENAFVYSMTVRGGRTFAYKGGGALMVSPIAEQIVATLAPSGDNTGYAAQRSRRRGA